MFLYLYHRGVSEQDFGARIRQLRQRAGISQAQLAAGLVTAPYISLIEHGRKLPSRHMQQQLLARLGVDTDAIAADQQLLSKVCAAVEMRDASAAQELMRCAPENPVSPSPHRKLAQALCDYASGFYSDALAAFLGLFNSFQFGSVEHLWSVRGACGCAHRTGQFEPALSNAKYVLTQMDSAVSSEAEHLRTTISGSCITMLSMRGDYMEALELCRQGLATAKSPWAAASALWVQAMTYERMDQPELAAMAAREAVVHARAANRPHDMAALNHLAAWLEMRAGDFDPEVIKAQLDAAESVLAQFDGSEELAAVKATRAELIARTVGIAQAEPLFEEAFALMNPAEHVSKARELTTLGILFMEQGHIEKAIDTLHRALRELSSGDNRAESARAWHRLGRAYEDAGLIDAALQCMKKATEHLGVRELPSNNASTSAHV